MTFVLFRITPADAGKTRPLQVFHVLIEDHPRGCGENGHTGQIPARLRGSPPRMRGKQQVELLGYSPSRITPADAGKTLLNAIQYALGEDHPRGCGENGVGTVRQLLIRGSPPRMRGKPPRIAR